MTESTDQRLLARHDLAWAIAAGGIGVVLFIALLWFAWHYAATLFLIFAGILLGVGLNAMTELLGRAVRLPQPVRLADRLPDACRDVVGRARARRRHDRATGDRAEQHDQIAIDQREIVPREERRRHQLFRSRPGRGLNRFRGQRTTPGAAAPTHNLPSASTLASSGGAIVSQSIKVLLGTVSVVGNFFIVAVSRAGLRRAARGLPRRSHLHRTGEISRRRR